MHDLSHIPRRVLATGGQLTPEMGSYSFTSPKHQALVLWGGWLVTGGVFFSVAGFFHEYYLSILGAPLAALVGIGAGELWAIRKRYRWVAAILLIAAAGGTLVYQLSVAREFVGSVWWLQPTVVALAAGAVLLAATVIRDWRRVAAVGFGCVIASLMIIPGVWSVLTALHSSDNQSLPAAYDGRSSGPPNSGGLTVDQSLLSYLEAHTQGTKYLMAVPSSMQGSDYVLATGRPVLYLGGFDGNDQVVTTSELSKMVADGELRYIYWDASGRGSFGINSDISSWVLVHGTSVQGFNTETQNAGAPGGTSRGPAGAGFGFRGGMQITLYRLSATASSN